MLRLGAVKQGSCTRGTAAHLLGDEGRKVERLLGHELPDERSELLGLGKVELQVLVLPDRKRSVPASTLLPKPAGKPDPDWTADAVSMDAGGHPSSESAEQG
jgi:hypothetical protein